MLSSEKINMSNPNRNRKQRINVTLHPTTLAWLDEHIPEKGKSSYIERLIRVDAHLPTLEERANSNESPETSGIGLKTS